MRLASTLLLSFIASTLFCGLLVVYLPFTKGDVIIWTSFLNPILWTAMTFYGYWPENRMQPIFVLTAIIVVSAILIWLS